MSNGQALALVVCELSHTAQWADGLPVSVYFSLSGFLMTYSHDDTSSLRPCGFPLIKHSDWRKMMQLFGNHQQKNRDARRPRGEKPLNSPTRPSPAVNIMY
jgi:hypothetical protein